MTRATVIRRVVLAPLFLLLPAAGGELTPLRQRGYAVVPTPQKVNLEAGDILFGEDWTVTGEAGSIAHRFLLADAAAFHRIRLRSGPGAGKEVRLAVRANTVATGGDSMIDRQAYRLHIADDVIEITGNAGPGLFYGVQTLLQLVRRDPAGALVLPRGVIEDWPKLALRFLHWDTKHHQDRLETLKRYLDWAARFKANMIGFELEDKFEYPSHPVIGAPGAFTTAQLQEIVDYGLERHIQVVPVIQAPAHMAYVLKHPEFAELRADGNNYQISLCDPRAYDLIFSMYDDVIRATRGVDYFYVSTDEYYYAGIDARCTAPYNEESRSLQWVQFVQRARDHLAKHGRRPLAWVEYPLLPQHAAMLPPELIDGVIGEEEYLPAEKKLGMRQLIYFSTQGAELLFPNHLSVGGEHGVREGRVEQARETLTHGRAWRGNPIGAFAAAWGDSGLHNETFWLGWSAVAQWSWHPGGASPEQHTAEFMDVYYGPQAAGMAGVYRLLQEQALTWRATWDREASKVRGPGYGNSYGKGIGTTRYDLTLKAPPLPELPGLRIEPRFATAYAGYVAAARRQEAGNADLLAALHENFGRAGRNRYNLEVFVALGRFMGHHWRLLVGLESAEGSLVAAGAAARENKAEEAVGRLVSAYREVDRLRAEGEAVFDELRRVFEKSQYPKGRSVDGRQFFHRLDDTKDHWADRTADLGYMMAPERGIGLKDWLAGLEQVARAYAKIHNVPLKGLAEARLEE